MKTYFKVAIRNFKKTLSYALLNIGGLTIGIACALLILLWVQDEISYDRFHANGENIYRVLELQHYSGGEVFPVAVTPAALGPALKIDIPEIIKSCRTSDNHYLFKKGNENINEQVLLVDSDFLEMFNIKFLFGNVNDALEDPYNIIISTEIAQKYFDKENVVGETLIVNKNQNFTVKGVFDPLPENSHLSQNIYIPFTYLKERGTNINEWGSNAYKLFVELAKGTNSKLIDDKIQYFLKKYSETSTTELFLQNIADIHLHSSGIYAADYGGLGDITYVRIFIIVAIFILVIACINFMNLSTAQSSKRAKEIGMRKIIGSNRMKIAYQFMSESMVLSLLAMLLALLLVQILLPGFNQIAEKDLAINYTSPDFYFKTFGLAIFCGLLAGSYPAFFLSSFNPLRVIKGVVSKNNGNENFRRVLVIAQFTLSVLLITCTLIIGKQLTFMQNKKLGLNKDNIGYFWFGNRIKQNSETLKNELLLNVNIKSVSLSHQLPTNIGWSSSGFGWEGKSPEDDKLFHMIFTDENYADVFKLELIEGRYFSKEHIADENAIVINQKAAEIMGMENPLGKLVYSGGNELTIIGVVKNFHFKSVKNEIEPLFMMTNKNYYNLCFVRLGGDNVTEIADFIKETTKNIDPESPIEFRFVDEDYDRLYGSEKRLGSIFKYFSMLAIIISCLGLIGLSSFMAERRTKEIGVRKTNGAKTKEVFGLMVKDFMMWVMLSVIIASPIAYILMSNWLQSFAFHTKLSWWLFASAGLLSVVIAFFTVSFQSWKAASQNPIKSLRYE